MSRILIESKDTIAIKGILRVYLMYFLISFAVFGCASNELVSWFSRVTTLNYIVQPSCIVKGIENSSNFVKISPVWQKEISTAGTQYNLSYYTKESDVSKHVTILVKPELNTTSIYNDVYILDGIPEIQRKQVIAEAKNILIIEKSIAKYCGIKNIEQKTQSRPTDYLQNTLS